MPTSDPSPVTARNLTVPLTPPQAVAATTLRVDGLPGADGAVVALAHSAGGGPDAPDLRAVTAALVAAGCVVVRFSFAYRLAGRRRPDPPARLASAWRDVIAALRRDYGDRPLLLGGRSMGGRIASMVAAEGAGDLAGLLLLAYPLRSPPRTAHWPQLRVQVLFVVGDRDPLCDLTLLRHEVNERLNVPKRVHVVAGADHSFRVRERDGRPQQEVYAEVGGAAARWVARPRFAE